VLNVVVKKEVHLTEVDEKSLDRKSLDRKSCATPDKTVMINKNVPSI